MTQIADFEWYGRISKEKGMASRCPFATVEVCPRYYQSLSLLPEAGFTGIPDKENAKLLKKWKSSDLWPKIDEQATSVSKSDSRLSTLSNFCPEVLYDSFGYFCTFLSSYADEIESDMSHRMLNKQGAASNDPRWRWSSAISQHYSECPLFSVIEHRSRNETRHVAAVKPVKSSKTERISNVENSQLTEAKEPLVFMSYDTRDIALVNAIDDVLQRIFNKSVKTFIAKRDIKAGDDAFKTMLHENLAKCAVVLAVCTKRSVTSPWLWFESGAGFEKSGLIPVWSGVKPLEFKAPMTIFQGKNIQDKDEVHELLSKIAEVTKIECGNVALTEDEFTKLVEISVKLDETYKSYTEESPTNKKEITNDMKVVSKIFEEITSLKELDYFIDQALYPYLIHSVLEQHEYFERYLQSSFYHVYDNKLRELICNFHISWSEVCQYWQAFTPTNVPDKLRPNTVMDIAKTDDVATAIENVPKAAERMHQSLKELLKYIRNTFSDINL